MWFCISHFVKSPVQIHLHKQTKNINVYSGVCTEIYILVTCIIFNLFLFIIPKGTCRFQSSPPSLQRQPLQIVFSYFVPKRGRQTAKILALYLNCTLQHTPKKFRHIYSSHMCQTQMWKNALPSKEQKRQTTYFKTEWHVIFKNFL